ncbi:hypothetical protein EJB05_01726, partial [Eragrostis curvula]
MPARARRHQARTKPANYGHRKARIEKTINIHYKPDDETSELCLLMEFVSGPSLHAYLSDDDKPPLRERTVRALMWQLLMGAHNMHQRRVVHRDIKPGNILLDSNHRSVKICHLGLALFTKLPPPYMQVGTLPYMAPEMLLGKADYDERVDTWSLGCVMAVLLFLACTATAKKTGQLTGTKRRHPP